MSETAIDRWREIVGGAFSFQLDAFQKIATLPYGIWLALAIVLLSGLSLAIAQSIILFISRVRPTRFVFSLLLNAVLFAIGFIFLTLSTWIICLLPWSVRVPLPKLIAVFGLGYAPLLFGFLGALPYFGYPIGNLLSVWNLLAVAVGFAAVANVEVSSAFIYVALGWGVKQLLEGTIGQPIASFGSKLADRVAGVALADTHQELIEQLLSGPRSASPILAASQIQLPGVREFVRISGRSAPEAAQSVAETLMSGPRAATQLNAIENFNSSNPLVQIGHQTRRMPQSLKLGLSLLGMAVLFAIVLVLLGPIRNGVFGWYRELPRLFRLMFDLAWIGVVAFVFAGILAPLESLGWWAGWYGEDLDTAAALKPIPPSPDQRAIDRYVVYLDGIAQSGDEYTPDIEDFLRALKPALPKGVELLQGLMMYSVLNRPLDENRPLAFLWCIADRRRFVNPSAVLGLLVNLRNAIVVAVSSDKRYGPVYNQGIAQVIFDGLLARGYQPGSGVPITLLGYSGGGEMSVAAAPYLKRSTGAPIEVISLGGVMSANHNVLKLEHLYHIVGDKDTVERAGPILFPGRWKLFPLSYWNRAKRKGKITILSAGPIAHQVPGGYMDPQARLPDGRTHLQQTIETILQILRGETFRADRLIPRQTSNWALYREADFNRPDYYPIAQTVDLQWYRPIGDWMGRLVLPKLEDRSRVRGVWFEVHYAPEDCSHFIGQTVKLRWVDRPDVQQAVKAVTKDLHFSADAEFSSRYGGAVHPDRLNHWRQVDPLESLAGAHPMDDIIVMLDRFVEVREDALYIDSTPIQITGRFYALVRFLQPVAGTDGFEVIHFDRASRQFSGKTEVMRLPEVVLAKAYGSYPSTTRDLEKSQFNETGWYVYGAQDAGGLFVVQSIGPRALFRLQPEAVVFGRHAAYSYIRQRAWADIASQKGKISSVLCTSRSDDFDDAIQTALDEWQEGDRALLLHTYGGIGGKRQEPAAGGPIFFGHFAYGVATAIRDPLADELRFDICYYQVYTQNTDGLVAGTLHWSRYMGDRQFGWLGTRPTCDILIELEAYTKAYQIGSIAVSPLELMTRHLQVMTARYRTGDGTGGTFVGPANNCSQDSNQALFASIRTTDRILRNPEVLQLLSQEPDLELRFKTLLALLKDLEETLEPLGGPRSDWEKNEYNLGSSLEDNPLQNLWTGIGSWRTMLPRKASDAIVHEFLKYGASVWVLRTNQIGGNDPDIEPIAPLTL
ncbi:MAG: CAAX protease [Oscillatoriaceae cyanobacterium Prado104]|jgi:predicted Abi (CAAX) family protease|nr:CAAX protease [Oscillatoriaceae cyanobacterium Prado104]